jgi:chromate transporter
VLSGVLCTVAIYLPGLLLAIAGLRVAGALRAHAGAAGALTGVAAGSVGVLAAACVRPVGVEAIHGWGDVGWALAAVAALGLRAPPWAVVVGYAAVAWAGWGPR